jgi:hypothetical protein
METCCRVCGAIIRHDDANVVTWKLKGNDDNFVHYHWGCWVEKGRFHHLNIDYGYYVLQMESSFFRPSKK